MSVQTTLVAHTGLQCSVARFSDLPTTSRQAGPFSIDLFALHTNGQLSTYCSWKLDPSGIPVNALSIAWRDHHSYLFPPFSLLSRCLEKIHWEVEAVIIAPVWCNQVWYPLLLQSLQDAPILLPDTRDIILNPQ